MYLALHMRFNMKSVLTNASVYVAGVLAILLIGTLFEAKEKYHG